MFKFDSQTQSVAQMIADPELVVILGIAPSVRIALGEEFGCSVGVDVKGKIATAARLLGFDKVFDVSMFARSTIEQLSKEFFERLNSTSSASPMLTNYCTGLVSFLEFYYPAQLANLSKTKSPQQIFGTTTKTLYANKNSIDPAKIRVVTVMPCVAKKMEAKCEIVDDDKICDMDGIVTTSEFAKMIRAANIEFKTLNDSQLDQEDIERPAPVVGLMPKIGGVMEAALRVMAETKYNKTLPTLNYVEIDGTPDIKATSFDLNGKTINICVIKGLKNARKVMDEIKDGKSPYHFIEIMSCPERCKEKVQMLAVNR